MKKILLLIFCLSFIYSCTEHSSLKKKTERINKENSAKEIISFSIVSKHPELSSKTGTDVAVNQMITKHLSSEETLVFKDYEFTFNIPKEGALNFSSQEGKLMCETSFELSIKSMPPDGKASKSYFRGDHFEVSPMTLITIGSTKFLIKDIKYTE